MVLHGVVGGDCSRNVEHRLAGTRDPLHPRAVQIFEDLGDRFEWTIPKDLKEREALTTAFREAIREATESIPEVDKRISVEDHAARVEECSAREAARIEETRRREEAAASFKIPPGAVAAVVAELDVDECDSMSDYYGSSTSRRVLIGWRFTQRESFANLRKCAATFEPTSHLGPGRDVWTVRKVYSRDMETPARVGTREGDVIAVESELRAETEEDLRALMESVELETDYQAWGRVQKTSVEHRENYSMGGGELPQGGVPTLVGLESLLRSCLQWQAVGAWSRVGGRLACREDEGRQQRRNPSRCRWRHTRGEAFPYSKRVRLLVGDLATCRSFRLGGVARPG